ncbi:MULTISPECIES: efflux RND transporter periplasmic adaptor subunit [unclassified Pseudomonas]|uniref:efflux RND transporter periplasmic adaptor subunit n=1 Tax=unclassified Pseudomonas TaxID=196821 RepID=UPI000C2FD014|nr:MULTISPECIES: efflux RND transporter periplasmic adaptor subunit [unclassified Pseudomonas]MCU1739307.1 efflux RND transporter periplasmic adaptor subunit [Pseudomonas sp. 20S_6.2_Bac1]
MNRHFAQPQTSWIKVCLVALLLSGCSRTESVEPSVTRAVKVETARKMSGTAERFTGIVRQRQRASLAFESAGRLDTLRVDVGDTVRQGQVLATLDPQALRLRLEQARASLSSSQAQAVEREGNYRRQQRLYTAGSVAQSVVESAAAAYEQAQAGQRRAVSDLALAQREVERGQLVAPFSGRIVARLADRYAQLTPGKVVLELESTDDRQVVAAVPAVQAQGMKPGDVAVAYTAAQPSTPLDLVLEGVSPRAENGLLQTCIFRLRSSSVALSSGLAVLVQLHADAPRGLSIAVSALSMGLTSSNAQVFVYQPTATNITLGSVTTRSVSITGVEQGRALIDSGLADGEQVVTAGVAFLSNGQAVSLYQPSTRLAHN